MKGTVARCPSRVSVRNESRQAVYGCHHAVETLPSFLLEIPEFLLQIIQVNRYMDHLNGNPLDVLLQAVFDCIDFLVEFGFYGGNLLMQSIGCFLEFCFDGGYFLM